MPAVIPVALKITNVVRGQDGTDQNCGRDGNQYIECIDGPLATKHNGIIKQ
jgi:hypothetical protein